MLVASELATSGSVMANAERISPSSSGISHRCFCSSVPKSWSTSMLPVSGAEQLQASEAIGEWPNISASGPRLRLQLLHERRLVVGVARVAQLLRIDRLCRVDVLVHERAEALLELGA